MTIYIYISCRLDGSLVMKITLYLIWVLRKSKSTDILSVVWRLSSDTGFDTSQISKYSYILMKKHVLICMFLGGRMA